MQNAAYSLRIRKGREEIEEHSMVYAQSAQRTERQVLSLSLSQHAFNPPSLFPFVVLRAVKERDGPTKDGAYGKRAHLENGTE